MPSHVEALLMALRHHLPMLQKRYAVRSLGIFGSRVRGEARADSDVDLLVTFDTVPSLFTFIELECDLSDLLDVKVDLVMQNALKPAMGSQILQEVIPIES